jgi:hypothetical protein
MAESRHFGVRVEGAHYARGPWRECEGTKASRDRVDGDSRVAEFVGAA